MTNKTDWPATCAEVDRLQYAIFYIGSKDRINDPGYVVQPSTGQVTLFDDPKKAREYIQKGSWAEPESYFVVPVYSTISPANDPKGDFLRKWVPAIPF